MKHIASRRLLRRLVATAAIVTTACGPAAGSAVSDSEAEYGVTPRPPLPVRAPYTAFDPTLAIADHDGSVIVRADGDRVVFEASNTEAVVEEGGPGALRTVSSDGRLAALFERSADGTSLITVVDQSGSEGVRFYELSGLVEPEAFSTDGRLLYVIDHQVAEAPGAYRVRPLDLATGRLATIVGPNKVPVTEDMNGRGRRQVWSPDGTRLYTLYIRQTHHHHASGGAHSHGEPGTDAFVHVLDLDEEWAHCLDLPAAFGGGELATTALAVAPDGASIAVADASAGQLAFASTADLEVVSTAPLPDIEIDGELHIGLAENQIILGSGMKAWWFDSETLTPVGDPVELESPLTGFTSALTPDGERLLAWTENLDNGPTALRRP